MTGQLRPTGSTRAWRATRLQVLTRDGHRCQLCGCALTTHDPQLPTHATVDHVVERAAWPDGVPGLDDPANLRAACRLCNGQRAADRTNAARRGTAHPLGASRVW